MNVLSFEPQYSWLAASDSMLPSAQEFGRREARAGAQACGEAVGTFTADPPVLRDCYATAGDANPVSTRRAVCGGFRFKLAETATNGARLSWSRLVSRV